MGSDNKFVNMFNREVFLKELDNNYVLHVWRDEPDNSELAFADWYIYTALLTDSNPEHDCYVVICQKGFPKNADISQEDQIADLDVLIKKYMPEAQEKFDKIVSLYESEGWETGFKDNYVQAMIDGAKG